jgi:hypothetical protein
LGFYNVGLSTIWVPFTSAIWLVISVCGKVCLCWVCVILVFFFVGPKLLGCFGFLFEIRVSMSYFWVGLFLTKVKWWLDLGFLGLLLYVA